MKCHLFDGLEHPTWSVTLILNLPISQRFMKDLKMINHWSAVLTYLLLLKCSQNIQEPDTDDFLDLDLIGFKWSDFWSVPNLKYHNWMPSIMLAPCHHKGHQPVLPWTQLAAPAFFLIPSDGDALSLSSHLLSHQVARFLRKIYTRALIFFCCCCCWHNAFLTAHSWRIFSFKNKRID